MRGGISGLDLDDQHFSSIGGGDVQVQSRDGGDVGYVVEITGGASRLSIDTAPEGNATRS